MTILLTRSDLPVRESSLAYICGEASERYYKVPVYLVRCFLRRTCSSQRQHLFVLFAIVLGSLHGHMGPCVGAEDDYEKFAF